MNRLICTLVLLCVVPTAGLLAQTPTPFTVNNASREQTRQFYNAIYNASEDVPMGWTGNYTAVDPLVAAGTTSAAYKEAVRVRINFFRALVGIPAGITLNPTYSAMNQQSALMMSANNSLSHTPPNTWLYYTTDGYTAAGNSNLAIGSAGPDAISGYMMDSGANNYAAGHRRWLIYPQTQQMGTGDVPGSATYYPANTAWVIDGHFSDPRPATRTTAITYPPAGYVPYQLVWPRWSFSYPGANYSAATVTMTLNGQSIAVAPETTVANTGEPAIVWRYNNLDGTSEASHPKPSADTTYTVTVNNVSINSTPQNFSYAVTVFDPTVPGSDATPTAVSIASSVPVGQATPFTVSAPAFASDYEYRTVGLSAFTKSYNAENGLDGITAYTGAGYSVVQTVMVGAGTASYHLAKPDVSIVDDTLTLPGTFYAPDAAASLSFLSRLGYASSTQFAHVQLALDDGTAWFDVYSQAGTNGAGETSFTTRTISLAAYRGRTFRVRFLYSYSGTGNYYYDTDPSFGVGWYLDNIALTGLQGVAVSSSAINSLGAAGSITINAPSTVGLQARGRFFSAYPMEWGPVSLVNASSQLAIATQPASQSVFTGSSVTFTAVATGTAPLSYQWSKNNVAISGATSATYTIPSVLATDAGSYTVVVSNSQGNITSNAATLTVTPSGNAGGYLANLSVRAAMGAGQTLIVGFVVNGGSKPILVRAAGPALNNYGLTGVIDPSLTLYNGGTVVAANDNWETSLASTFAALGAFPFGTGSKDAALLQTISGPHTAQATATGSGAILVETYDAGSNNGPKLVNVSTRFQVGTGDNILIAGFVVAGTGSMQVLVRAVGPTLASYGVTGTLADPQLSVFDGGTVIASNDNWPSSLTPTFDTVGAFHLLDASKDAAVVLTVQAGKQYTAQVSGVGNTTGEALIEVYALP